jgi:hypothetical protein
MTTATTAAAAVTNTACDCPDDWHALMCQGSNTTAFTAAAAEAVLKAAYLGRPAEATAHGVLRCPCDNIRAMQQPQAQQARCWLGAFGSWQRQHARVHWASFSAMISGTCWLLFHEQQDVLCIMLGAFPC